MGKSRLHFTGFNCSLYGSAGDSHYPTIVVNGDCVCVSRFFVAALLLQPLLPFSNLFFLLLLFFSSSFQSVSSQQEKKESNKAI